MTSGFRANKRNDWMVRVGVAIVMFVMNTSHGQAGPGLTRGDEQWDAQQPTAVIINGQALTAGQVCAFRTVYGIAPQPGEYWYDTHSGLWGVVDQPAAGFLHAGHDLGMLTPHASSGDSGVFVNGRELTAQEVRYFSEICGGPWPKGAYRLDAQGFVSFADSPLPLCNLWVQHATAVTHTQAEMPAQPVTSNGYGNAVYVSQGCLATDPWTTTTSEGWRSGLFSSPNRPVVNHPRGDVRMLGYGAMADTSGG